MLCSHRHHFLSTSDPPATWWTHSTFPSTCAFSCLSLATSSAPATPSVCVARVSLRPASLPPAPFGCSASQPAPPPAPLSGHKETDPHPTRGLPVTYLPDSSAPFTGTLPPPAFLSLVPLLGTASSSSPPGSIHSAAPPPRSGPPSRLRSASQGRTHHTGLNAAAPFGGSGLRQLLRSPSSSSAAQLHPPLLSTTWLRPLQQ